MPVFHECKTDVLWDIDQGILGHVSVKYSLQCRFVQMQCGLGGRCQYIHSTFPQELDEEKVNDEECTPVVWPIYG